MANEWAMFWRIIVFPALGGETINDLCPLPIGLTRSINRAVRSGFFSTGMSTGPHLHYEVIVNKKKVNSQRLKLPSAKRLNKEARKDFEIERIKIDLKIAELKKD